MSLTEKTESKKESLPTGEIPILYLWIYKKYIDKYGELDRYVSRKELIETMHRTIYQVPRKYDWFIIKEIEFFGMIEKVDNVTYRLKGRMAPKLLKKLNLYYLV